MGEAFLDNDESDNGLKIPFLISISELFNYPDYVIDEICLLAKDTDKLCIIPIFSMSEKEDKVYERISYEKFFCENYDKLVEYKDKIYLRTINSSEIHRVFGVRWNYAYVSLERIKKVNDKIEMFTADIKNSSLSPFEKVMAIYMVATQFIESYKGNSVDVYDSDSSVMHILSDDEDGYKIQCAGYTDLFCRMAYECGICTQEMAMVYDDVTVAHSVAIVDLDDEKYGIHGSFICDVRGESDFQEYHQQMINVDNYNGFNYFCLPFRDFDAMSKVLTNVSKTCRYAINNIEITGEEDKYISNERINISNIFIALNHLYQFIFENDGKRSILKEHDFDGILLLNTVRDRIDEANKTGVSVSSSHK